jgi:hypothetical protein
VRSTLALKSADTDAIEFRVSSAGRGTEQFRGKFGPCANPFGGREAPQALLGEMRRFTDDDRHRFAASYPEMNDGWIALDALVFSDFMRHRFNDTVRLAQARLSAIAGAASECLFVQTSHTVCFDPESLGRSGPLGVPLCDLRCAMTPPQVVEGQDRMLGLVTLPVFHGDQPVMQVEIGMLARSPMQPQRSTPSLRSAHAS